MKPENVTLSITPEEAADIVRSGKYHRLNRTRLDRKEDKYDLEYIIPDKEKVKE
jgi:hypothetical protein